MASIWTEARKLTGSRAYLVAKRRKSLSRHPATTTSWSPASTAATPPRLLTAKPRSACRWPTAMPAFPGRLNSNPPEHGPSSRRVVCSPAFRARPDPLGAGLRPAPRAMPPAGRCADPSPPCVYAARVPAGAAGLGRKSSCSLNGAAPRTRSAATGWCHCRRARAWPSWYATARRPQPGGTGRY